MDTASGELKIFIDYYGRLCNTLVDIEILLPYFVQEAIIDKDKHAQILAMPTTANKIRYFLINISGLLEAGYAKIFFYFTTYNGGSWYTSHKRLSHWNEKCCHDKHSRLAL